MTIDWQEKVPQVYGATVQLHFKQRNKIEEVHLRIDGRNNEWRIDRYDFAVWVAIDGWPHNIKSCDEAKAYAIRWCEAVQQQETLQPKRVSQ